MKSILIVLILLMSTLPVTDNVTSRFKLPLDYRLIKPGKGSFGAWLQNLSLMPAGTHTKTYRGDIARTDVYTAAVIDMSVGHEDLQQCADVVMRLRGEYLYQQHRYNEITFNFVSGFKCDYLHFANGYRYVNDHWVLKGKKDYSYTAFMRYMNLVFSYAGTLSLQKELKPVSNTAELAAGDVFIHGGSPGHCFIVLEVIENSKHRRQFLLAQSFMPAQNIQVLQYAGSPWFSLDRQSDIAYGELISPLYLRKF